jgi:Rhodopirellula transposase DDE domain
MPRNLVGAVAVPLTVDLIGATTTKSGLRVRCELDANIYATGIKVTDAQMAALNIKGDAFHPEWNYTIASRPPKPSI